MTDRSDNDTIPEPEIETSIPPDGVVVAPAAEPVPETAEAPPPRISRSVSISRCCTQGCDCDHVFINFHDEKDRVFAFVPMPSSVGYVVAADIVNACDAVRELQHAVRASKPRKH